MYRIITTRTQRIETYVYAEEDEAFDVALEQDDWTVLETFQPDDVEIFEYVSKGELA
jgi:hypothetical protein